MSSKSGKDKVGRQVKRKQNSVNNANSAVFVDKLLCFKTNADSLRNQFTEFQVRIRDSKPKIIGITEVKAKNSWFKLNPAEFIMEWCVDYDMFSVNIDNDIGRGMLLYVHKSLSATEVKLDIEYEENVFVKIRTSNSESLLVGLIYRSDSGTDDNNRHLCDIIEEAGNMKYTHYLIMGDFNYPAINWDTLSTRGERADEQRFLDCLQDNYFFQMTAKPTMWRGTDKPNILDLVITRDENSISDMEHQSPLGKSDHCVLLFNFVCFMAPNRKRKERRCYNKANYAAIKEELMKVNWDEQLDVSDIDESWKRFCKILYNLEDRYVPLTTIRGGARGKQVPLSKDIIAKIKEKNALSRKFVETKDSTVRTKYKKKMKPSSETD